jgi:predicted RecB family nuclease
MKKHAGQLIYSPSDLIRFLASPFASWMDRYYLEDHRAVTPDEESEDQKLIIQTGEEHERTILGQLKATNGNLVEITKSDLVVARTSTLAAIRSKAPIVFQAALELAPFAGFTDFLILDASGKYQVWDAKLARAPKPYYAVQLCCYSEMLAAVTGEAMPEKFGIILGSQERVEFRVEDFFHYYRHVKANFLEMQAEFTGNLADRPEPLPRADHGRWTSQADNFFTERNHLVQVANISVGQIKKLNRAGIATVVALASSTGKSVPKLNPDSLEKLVAQARLQVQTRTDRQANPEAPPRFEVLASSGDNGEPVGLATLPPAHPADVYFDMEGYPLAPGGQEYLFGVCIHTRTTALEFKDWWAHDRAEEKLAFERFVDWVFARWRAYPALHIYHYAAYEVSALRRLSTRHDTRQDEVDELLRNEVFLDLYQLVRHGLRIGEDSYTLKVIERLYRPKRATEVASAADSIVQYARWIESRQPRDWPSSTILKDLRDYNQDDCQSTAELVDWLRRVARDNGITPIQSGSPATPPPPKPLSPEVVERQRLIAALREQAVPTSLVLADLVDFHRRELKPMWWRMFDRAKATAEELRDDPSCIEGVEAVGHPVIEKRSLVQAYRFDPNQECKLAAGKNSKVKFAHNLDITFDVVELDLVAGQLRLKASKVNLDANSDGAFPQSGSLLKDESIRLGKIPGALTDLAAQQLTCTLPAPIAALLGQQHAKESLLRPGETPLNAAIRIAGTMVGGWLVIQGPPGTGKTYSAAQVISGLLAQGKRVGLASNSHKAVVNLLAACGEAVMGQGGRLHGIKVGSEPDRALMAANPGLTHVDSSGDARGAYTAGVVAGTAWLFSRPEWVDQLDYLFIDEAGQVSLANAVAMARSAKNLVLLGDQMQLEQPVQGTHPGDAGLSALQYALKDIAASKPDAPILHAVVPPDLVLFLAESRRMHPEVCGFISDSIYEGRLHSHPDCARQKIALPPGGRQLVTKEAGIVFSGVEHEGNIQQSDEEVERVKAIYQELLGCLYTDKEGNTRPLVLEDFLFIAPYNAQVRSLTASLPPRAKVASVDKFQGQEAPVCILCLCSSYGEYGSRGLGFILDRNRINVAISRAQCLAIVVADPRIANSPAGSIAEMKLLNLFCKLKPV